jgi:hypothetical protein
MTKATDPQEHLRRTDVANQNIYVHRDGRTVPLHLPDYSFNPDAVAPQDGERVYVVLANALEALRGRRGYSFGGGHVFVNAPTPVTPEEMEMDAGPALAHGERSHHPDVHRTGILRWPGEI